MLPAILLAQRPVIRPTMPTVPTIGNRTIGTGPSSDSLRHRNYDDSLNLKFYYLDSTRAHRLDSSISDFYQRFPIPADYITLGNTGSPARSLLFRPSTRIGWDPGFHTLDIYRKKLEDVRFYNTNRSYTELNYLLGPKAEQIIEVLQTQNIKPYWNASFNYRLINAPGLFRNQRTNHNTYTITSWYESPRKRYNNYFIFLFNKLQAGENGGIRDDHDYLHDPVYSRDRFTIPTKLGGEPRFGANFFSTVLYTGRRETDMNFFLRQQYDLGRKDSLVSDTVVIPLFFPRVRFEHNIHFQRSRYHYQDYKVSDGKQTNFPDSAYYAGNYGLTMPQDSLLFEDAWARLRNDFSIYQFPDEKNLQQFIKLGAELELLKGSLKREESFYNVVGHAEYRNRTKNQKWDMLALGRLYLAGENVADYHAFVSLQRQLGDSGSLKIGFENVNRSPSFLYRTESNFYLAAPRNFSKENTTHFFATFQVPKLQVQLTGDYYLMSNYLYFNKFYLPQQESGLFNLLRIGASRQFRLSRHLNWYADAAIQQKTGAVELNVPFFYTRNRLAFEGNFFRNLNLSTGLDIRYYSPYKADNYSPVLGQFFYQDSVTISNRPDVAAYFHVRIRTLKMYVRLENLNTINAEGKFNDNNFAAPGYPTPGMVLRFGIYWSFVN